MDKQQDTTSLWFRLVAASNQENSNLNVSYLKKYIVKKLDLKSEDEVELYVENEPLDSLMTLNELSQYWIMANADCDIINTQAGSSGAYYVMVVNYGRKSQHVPQFTHLATTNEVAPIDNEAAKLNMVLSTSQHVSSPSASASAQKSSKGRLIKPTQKKQEMDQVTTQSGRGIRGRGGRGGRG